MVVHDPVGVVLDAVDVSNVPMVVATTLGSFP